MTLTFNNVIQITLYMAALLLLAKPVGAYMAQVYEGKARFLAFIERPLYALFGTREDAEMGWKTYAVAMLLFNLLGFVIVYVLQRVQGLLPFNPAHMSAIMPDSAFNTAVSFASNTNWQGYGGETTMSYLTQMIALTVQNFVSAASGMATLVALIRGLSRKSSQHIGNFWVDMTKNTLKLSQNSFHSVK